MWTDLVKPNEEHMNWFLRRYVGADWWRTPMMTWRELFTRKRGQLNHIRPPMKSKIHVFNGPKYQRGMIVMATQFGVAPPPVGGTNPAETDVRHTHTTTAPQNARQAIRWTDNGFLEWDAFGGALNNGTYAILTTQTDDTNDHTDEWWPDQAEANIGDSYEIQFTNVTTPFTFTLATLTANRNVDQWYNISDVYDDSVGNTSDGCMHLNRVGGTSKNPNPGTANGQVDMEIGENGTSTAISSAEVFFTCITS